MELFNGKKDKLTICGSTAICVYAETVIVMTFRGAFFWIIMFKAARLEGIVYFFCTDFSCQCICSYYNAIGPSNGIQRFMRKNYCVV